MAGCFACFAFGKSQSRKGSALLADDDVADGALDDYMRKGVLVLDDTAGTLNTSRARLAEMGHTSNNTPTATSVRKQGNQSPSKRAHGKPSEEDRRESTASLDLVANREFDSMSSTRASERTTLAGSLYKQSSLQASERTSICGGSMSKTASLQASERSSSIVRTPASASAQEMPAMHKAWDAIMQNGNGHQEAAKPKPNGAARRGGQKQQQQQPSQKKQQQRPQQATETSRGAQIDQTPTKKGSYVRDWLKAQQELAREDSLGTVHSGVGVEEPAPLVKSISQISQEADHYFPGRDEVQAQARDMAREMAIRVCINDPDIISKPQRQRSGELPISPKSRQQMHLLPPTGEEDDIFNQFRSSLAV